MVEALDYRGLVDVAFFERLGRARPAKREEVEALQRVWFGGTSARPVPLSAVEEALGTTKPLVGPLPSAWEPAVDQTARSIPSRERPSTGTQGPGSSHPQQQELDTPSRNPPGSVINTPQAEVAGQLPIRDTATSHIILLVHGIRDQGEWEDAVARVLKQVPGLEVFPIGFGYLNVLAFPFPCIWRRRAIADVERKFNAAVAESPVAKVSVIAHSFGTYAVVELLKRRTDIRLHRLVLCGSIVPRTFHWGLLRPRVEHRIVNDFGYEDVWPVMAASLSFFSFGETGTFGCLSPQVIDRPHRFGHGGFFGRRPYGPYDPDFAERFWLPLFRDGQVVFGDRLPSRPRLLSLLPLVKWLVLVFVVTLTTWTSWNLIYAGRE